MKVFWFFVTWLTVVPVLVVLASLWIPACLFLGLGWGFKMMGAALSDVGGLVAGVWDATAKKWKKGGQHGK